MVVNFVNEDGQWDIEKLTNALPSDAVEVVVGMSPPRGDLGADRSVWGGEDNDRFSIKSAYNLLRNDMGGPIRGAGGIYGSGRAPIVSVTSCGWRFKIGCSRTVIEGDDICCPMRRVASVLTRRKRCSISYGIVPLQRSLGLNLGSLMFLIFTSKEIWLIG
ncbi:hypothetical protein LINPERHAP1_LOCUS41404 [Linum perenne]